MSANNAFKGTTGNFTKSMIEESVRDTLQISLEGYYTKKIAVGSVIEDTVILLRQIPKPLDYNGQWYGWTIEGEPISFTVSRSEITRLNYTLGMVGLTSYSVTTVSGYLATVTGGYFSYNQYNGTSFSGTFSGDTTVTGMIGNGSFSYWTRQYLAKKPLPSDTSNPRLMVLIRQCKTARERIVTFKPQEILYDSIPSTWDSLEIKPVSYGAAQITINDTTCAPGAFSPKIALPPGGSVFNVKVIAADTSDSMEYVLNVFKEISANASLKSLSVSDAVSSLWLSPYFDATQFDYTATTTRDSITISFAAAQNDARMMLDGDHVDGVSAVVGKRLNLGANVFVIIVKAADGENELTYTLTVNRSCITSHPQNVWVEPGQEVEFFVVTTGAGFQYQWQKNGEDIENATDSVYTHRTGIGENGALLRCIVSDGTGSDTSEPATLTVLGSSILTHPQDKEVMVGEEAAFFIVTTSAGFQYQWQKNGEDIENATDSVYTHRAGTGEDGARFRCIVSDETGSDTSDEATLSVYGSIIQVDPQNRSVEAGGETEFFVVTMGAGLQYQWQKYGEDIENATDSSYTHVAAMDDNLASFRCIVSDGTGSDTSNAAILFIPQYLDETVLDVDGNVYHTVRIGNRIWTVENLRVTKYNDGTDIPYVTDNGEWNALASPAFCYYDNTANLDSIEKFGALYNWYVVADTNSKKIAPAGWRIPTDVDWDTLQNYLIANGYNWDETTEGNKIAKAMAAKTDWNSSTAGGTPGNELNTNNASGFSALPGGYRVYSGVFVDLCYGGFWWNTTEYDDVYTGYCYLSYSNSYFGRESNYKRYGFSVRLVRDAD